VDGCAGYLDYARARYERGNVRFYTGYFDRKFPLEDPFDVVVCTEVLEHVREPSKLLGCLRDKACDGGVVLLTTPNADYFRFRLPSFTGATQEAIDSLVANSKDGEEHRYFFTREEVLTLMRGVGMKIAGSGFFLPVWLTGEMKFRWLHRCSFRLRGKPLMLSGLPPKGVRWCARYLCASQWFVGTRT
jgi:2-polyprenyl-3-methyl-5-hydroxy-6-metoxy-1,4-benzoquinol methylase